MRDILNCTVCFLWIHKRTFRLTFLWPFSDVSNLVNLCTSLELFGAEWWDFKNKRNCWTFQWCSQWNTTEKSMWFRPNVGKGSSLKWLNKTMTSSVSTWAAICDSQWYFGIYSRDFPLFPNFLIGSRFSIQEEVSRLSPYLKMKGSRRLVIIRSFKSIKNRWAVVQQRDDWMGCLNADEQEVARLPS